MEDKKKISEVNNGLNLSKIVMEKLKERLEKGELFDLETSEKYRFAKEFNIENK